MEVTLVVIKPRNRTLSDGEFKLNNYEILLVDDNLPTTSILLDGEPTHQLLQHLFNTTGGENGGLKGKRALYIPPLKNENEAVYCIPIDYSETISYLNIHLKLKTKFVVLDKWMQSVISEGDSGNIMAIRVQSWLVEMHTRPGAMKFLFSSAAEDRFKWSISNPAFVQNHPNYPFDRKTSVNEDNERTVHSSFTRKEILALMKSNDKCDVVVVNPLFGSNMSFKYKVDKLVKNKYWGLSAPSISSSSDSTPNYIVGHAGPSFISDSAGRQHMKNKYPLHKNVKLMNIEGVKRCLKLNYSVMQMDSYFDTPLHLAAENGFSDILELMLDETGSNVNEVNHLGQTLLHVAALSGKPQVVDLLLNRGIDTEIIDKYNKKALQYCMDNPTPNVQDCYRLIKRRIEQPVGYIDVHLMDGSSKKLVLISNADTTVEQLHRQMMKELKLPDNYANVFAIWICSRNLQLQLKSHHKPIEHLNDWKTKIVSRLTDQSNDKEDPELYWRRDVLLSLKDENLVNNAVAINYLFIEAYHNYMKSLYLCNEKDVIFLAGVILHLYHGPYVESTNLFDSNLLDMIIPQHMIDKQTRNYWIRNLIEQYKVYSSKVSNTSRPVHQLYFLKVCRLLTTYGCAFFTGYTKSRGKTNVWLPVFLGVNDVGLHIITVEPRALIKSFLYKEVIWDLVVLDKSCELHFRKKTSKKADYMVSTKQAKLIDNLMKKLSELCDQDK